jgi:hypothetical protein
MATAAARCTFLTGLARGRACWLPCPTNPTYDPEADARHWEALGRLYGTYLYGAR